MASDEELRSAMELALSSAMQNSWIETERLCQQVASGKSNQSQHGGDREKVPRDGPGPCSYKTADLGRRRELLAEGLAVGRRAVHAFARSSEPQEDAAGAHRAIGTAILFMITHEVIRNDEWATLYPEGIVALKKAIELDPQDEEARKRLALLYGAEQVAKMYGAKTGGCFIATAACGDPVAPEVNVLAGFRDQVLVRSGIGRAFVRLHCRVSPPIACMIARSDHLRRLTMVVLVGPAVNVVRALRGNKASLIGETKADVTMCGYRDGERIRN